MQRGSWEILPCSPVVVISFFSLWSVYIRVSDRSTRLGGLPMGYTNSADVLALRIEDDCEVSLKLWNLHLFSYGAFSNVYRGFVEDDTNAPKEVVIKKTWSGTQKASSLTSYEIQILKLLSRLNHKNIVRLLYSYRTRYSDNTCFSLILEFFPLSLYQCLKMHQRNSIVC